ncbi:MAG: ATP-binding cassette domain-containing protein [Methylobacteriaceae bacterium]|nr:ATP-binding cassette domain-containing protein [Methylobacteriaceae bacterium]
MLLEVVDIAKTFVLKQGWPVPKLVEVRALDGVSFGVDHAEALGVVGESGCGKSTAARVALRLIEADRGRVTFDGRDVLGARPAELRALRRRMQIVFQDPASALDPRQRVGAALMEPLAVHGVAKGEEARKRALAILDEVGLPKTAFDRFPHEFSGGQRQRIGIARALALEPDVIFADEPVSALDVSVQAQILKLLDDLKQRRRLAFVFVSHDLGVVRHFCERTVVMYLGRIIESGPTGEIFDAPKHPYTRVLREASPAPDPTVAKAKVAIEGEPPSPVAPPPGCHFHPRCPLATDICRRDAPALRDIAPARRVACHHAL